MMRASAPTTAVRGATIAIRAVVDDDGTDDPPVELFVHCRDRDESVALEECVRCEHCEGLRLNPGEHEALLVCRAPPRVREDPARSSTGRRMDSAADRTAVSEIMTRDVVCVPPEMDVETVTLLFLQKGISGAPVVNARGEPIGIVSKTDLLRELHERDDSGAIEPMRVRARGGFEVELGRGFHIANVSGATVQDIMMPVSFSLPQNETIARAAALMAFEGVHRVPVLAPDGTVAGLVSSLDVLRWLARGEGYVIAG